MAFKIKDNLDLYGNQLLNFALQSESGFYSSPQVGHMFYYTGGGGEANHAVICTETNSGANAKFRALAFVDEIANNADFVELKEKVDLLIGDDVDTDTIIDSWKEVQAFLADIEDTKTLQGMLSSYLPKSGGTITGNLLIGGVGNTAYSFLSIIRSGKGIRINNTANDAFFTFGTPDSNGDISQEKIFSIGNNGLRYSSDGTNYNTLLHSGNIGDYALKTDGSNEMTGRLKMQEQAIQWNANGTIQLLAPYSYYNYSLSYYNGTDWKQIAFTDSTVAAATRLEDGSGKYIAYVDTNNSRFYIGDNINSTTDMYLLGKNIQLRYGTSGTTGLILNSYGNVTIGDKDYAGTNAKLYVDGRINSERYILSNSQTTECGLMPNSAITSSGDSRDIWLYNVQALRIYSELGVYLSKTTIQDILSVSGNVLIGTTTDAGYKLYVDGTARISDAVKLGHTLSVGGDTTINGDLYVTGNIIATKEVSAGGAGQEGESGAGGAEVLTEELPSGVSLYEIPNTIARTDIAVSLYEWNANNESWDMCLADISVKDATITVTFGSATSVNHKLVAVG